jgi:hypothetical protein
MSTTAFATPPSAKARWLNVALLFLAAAAVALTDIWSCPFALVTGVPCPGCGMTRASLALLHGDLAAAFRLQPLSPVLVPIAALLSAETLFVYLWQRPNTLSERLLARYRVNSNWLWGIATVLLLGVWAARFFGAFGGPVSISGWTFRR